MKRVSSILLLRTALVSCQKVEKFTLDEAITPYTARDKIKSDRIGKPESLDDTYASYYKPSYESDTYNEIHTSQEAVEDYYYNGDEEPETVLGYLFKEAYAQLTGSPDNTKHKDTSKIQNRQSGEEDIYDESTDEPDNDTDLDGPGLLTRIQDRIFDVGSGISDDPVFNWIFWFSVLALTAQSYFTPFAKVTVTNANTRKKRSEL